MPRLEDWWVHRATAASKGVVFGKVYGDKRWENGTEIRTSPVQKWDFENNRVTTLTAVFELGNKIKEGKENV